MQVSFRPLSSLRILAPLVLAGFLLATFAASAQQAQTPYDDWTMRCETPPGAQGQQCALMQYVAAEDRPNVGLSVIVLKTADGKAKLLRVITPLGVLLPSGLGLKIDSEDVGRAGFVRCVSEGCLAEVIMEDALLDKLRRGEQATFIVFETPEAGIGIPISLSGFSAGYDALP
uniref:invasion associated locus B family protein n=1 Tax=Pararhizobium sp. IMCC3301 TaxID=3067904 RepID=UPI002741493A|nr:invasion associated locus B family protein [Pararhizobium sp. IMCC3301]